MIDFSAFIAKIVLTQQWRNLLQIFVGHV